MPIKNNRELEDWFLSRVEQLVRNQPPGERTPQCVNDDFLNAYAARPSTHSLANPNVVHVSSCSFCLRRFVEIRDRQKALNPRRSGWRRRYALLGGLVAACLIIGFLTSTRWHARQEQARAGRQVAEVLRTLDLSQDGTYRGEQPTLQPLSLPPAVVKLELILPRLSDPGNYTVRVATNETDKHVVADARGVAVGADPRTALTVTLDLRTVKPGQYVLSTERDSDGGPYSYPLRVE